MFPPCCGHLTGWDVQSIRSNILGLEGVCSWDSNTLWLDWMWPGTQKSQAFRSMCMFLTRGVKMTEVEFPVYWQFSLWGLSKLWAQKTRGMFRMAYYHSTCTVFAVCSMYTFHSMYILFSVCMEDLLHFLKCVLYDHSILCWKLYNTMQCAHLGFPFPNTL